MARVEYFEPELTANQWMGDVGNAENLLRASAFVNTAKWTADADTGRIAIPSGTLLGRRDDETYLFEPVATGLETNLATLLSTDEASGSTVLNVVTTSGFKVGDGITITDGTNTETATIAANGIDRANRTITITAGLTNAFDISAAATTVRLTTAVALTEFWLLAFDITDASEKAEIPALYRHNRQVRINFLPDYASLASDVAAKIRELYETVQAV